MSANTDGLPPVERAALRRCRRAATLLDEAVRLPLVRVRIGVDSVVGLLPVAGDIVTAVLSLYILFEAYRLDAPRSTLLRMVGNVLLDLTLGSVPVVGFVFDTVWKANSRNVRLLEAHLEI